jgi:uncharacterized protein (DUF433 family)
MSTQITEIIPIKEDKDGIIRINNSRVTLDSIVIAFKEGATAEEIAQQYPSVSLADIYSVIGYYLHHHLEVERYLKDRNEEAEQVKGGNEKRFNPLGIRARLQARQIK